MGIYLTTFDTNEDLLVKMQSIEQIKWIKLETWDVYPRIENPNPLKKWVFNSDQIWLNFNEYITNNYHSLYILNCKLNEINIVVYFNRNNLLKDKLEFVFDFPGENIKELRKSNSAIDELLQDLDEQIQPNLILVGESDDCFNPAEEVPYYIKYNYKEGSIFLENLIKAISSRKWAEKLFIQTSYYDFLYELIKENHDFALLLFKVVAEKVETIKVSKGSIVFDGVTSSSFEQYQHEFVNIVNDPLKSAMPNENSYIRKLEDGIIRNISPSDVYLRIKVKEVANENNYDSNQLYTHLLEFKDSIKYTIIDNYNPQFLFEDKDTIIIRIYYSINKEPTNEEKKLFYEALSNFEKEYDRIFIEVEHPIISYEQYLEEEFK